MVKTRRFAAIAVVVPLVLLLASCTGNPSEPGAQTPSASSPTTTPTPTPSATTESPEDLATAQAEDVVRAYYRAQVSCLSDPAASLPTCFDDVATATELTNMRNALSTAQQMGTKVTGAVEVISADAESVDLTNTPGANPPVVPEIVLSVCRDVSGFNIVDSSGKSIVPTTRVARGLDEVHVANYSYPDATQWRVAYVVAPQSGTTC